MKCYFNLFRRRIDILLALLIILISNTVAIAQATASRSNENNWVEIIAICVSFGSLL